LRSNKMTPQHDIKAMVTKIKALRQNAEALKEISGGIPAVAKNADRILACVRMLEIEINDVAEISSK
jgi:hypothetical protein